MTDDSKPKDDALSHSDEDQEVVDTAPRSKADDLDDDDDDDDDDEPVAPSAKAKAGVKHKKGKKSKAVVAKARPSAAPKASSSSNGSSAGLLAGLCLIAGAALGWFGHVALFGNKPSAEVHAATAAGETTCQAWSKAVCKGAGDKSSACAQTKEAALLLPDAACSAALSEVPATLAKVKDARKDCAKLVDKLCTDLGKTTGTCKMVTERTETFPTDRCKEMMTNYDKVLGQLKAMEERGGPGGPGGPGMSPHGASPHGPGGPGMPGAPGMPRLQAGPAGGPAGLPPGAMRLGAPKPAAPGGPAPGGPAPGGPAPAAPAPAPKPAQ